MSEKKVKEKKIYIKISSDSVNTITLLPDEVDGHLQEYYFDSLKDWFESGEKLTLQVVKMTENEYKKLPEWEP